MHQQHSSTMGIEMHDTLADFDFSGVFDDEPLDLWQEEPQSTAAVENKMVDALLQGTHCAAPHVPQGIPSNVVSPPTGLVNLYMIVDPSTGQVSMCPKQLLNFKNSNMPTTMIGPNLFHQNKFANGLFLGGTGSTQQSTSSPPNVMSLPMVQPIDHGTSFPRSSDMDFKLARPPPPTIVNGPPNTGLAPVVSKNNSAKPKKNTSPPVDISKLPVLRALSAYNFFFQAERDKILNGTGNGEDKEDDWSNERKQQMLQAHWGRDRTKKRRHRKSHGRISFIELSKEISSRWKKLPDERKEFYRDVAAQDFARYQRETKDSASQEST